MRSEWDLLGRLGLAIGLERAWRQTSAGLRTSTLVGLGSALFLLVGEYGVFDALQPGHVVLDPSRVAAQIVSGIGFIGGGLIFLRQDAARGPTAAAGVWPVDPFIARRLPSGTAAVSPLRVTYVDGRGVLREVLSRVTGASSAVSGPDFRRHDEETVDVAVRGRAPVIGLVTELGGLDGVLLVNAADADPD